MKTKTALKIAASLCSWNNVLPKHIAVMRGLSRRGLITPASSPDRSLQPTEKGILEMKKLGLGNCGW